MVYARNLSLRSPFALVLYGHCSFPKPNSSRLVIAVPFLGYLLSLLFAILNSSCDFDSSDLSGRVYASKGSMPVNLIKHQGLSLPFHLVCFGILFVKCFTLLSGRE
jgi:hypothetical protein